MKFSVTGQEKCDLLIQVTAWAGLTVFKNKFKNLTRTNKFKFSFRGLIIFEKKDIEQPC
jgi:hypothetical protein